MDQQDPESRQIGLFSEHLGLKRTNQYESDILFGYTNTNQY